MGRCSMARGRPRPPPLSDTTPYVLPPHTFLPFACRSPPAPVVQHVQLPRRNAPRAAHAPPKAPPSGADRLRRLRAVRHGLQLAARRQDVPPGERDARRVRGGRARGRRRGRYQGTAREGVEDADIGKWAAGGDVFGAVEAFYGSVGVSFIFSPLVLFFLVGLAWFAMSGVLMRLLCAFAGGTRRRNRAWWGSRSVCECFIM